MIFRLLYRELKLISCIQNDFKVSSQGKEVGEPQEKKVRTLLENEEEDEEGLDEEPEEVIFLPVFFSVHPVHLINVFNTVHFT